MANTRDLHYKYHNVYEIGNYNNYNNDSYDDSYDNSIDDDIYLRQDSVSAFVITSIIYAAVFGSLFNLKHGIIFTFSPTHYTLMFVPSLVVYTLIFIVVLLFYINVVKWRRNFFTELLVASVPCEVFLLLENTRKFTPLFVICISMMLAVLIHDGSRIMRDVRARQRRRMLANKSSKINYRRVFSKFGTNLRRRLEATVFVFLGLVLASTITSGLITKAKSLSKNVQQTETYAGGLFEANKDNLVLLDDDIYWELSDEKKLELVQMVVNIEMGYLGCRPVQVSIQCICGDDLAGYYRDDLRLIVIDEEIANGDYGTEYMISVLLHEAFHAYEYECVRSVDLTTVDTNLYMYRDIKEWADNIKNYHEFEGHDAGYESYIEYSSQRLETSADEYSEKWTPTYMDYIYDLNHGELE